MKIVRKKVATLTTTVKHVPTRYSDSANRCESCGAPIPERRGASPFCSRPCCRRRKRTKEKAERRSRRPIPRTVANTYVWDPVVPDISPSDVCTEIAVRAYAYPKKNARAGSRSDDDVKDRSAVDPKWVAPTLDGRVAVFDCESVKHAFTFGVLEFYSDRKLRRRTVFCRDDLPTTDPAGYQRLCEICESLGVKLCFLTKIFSDFIWPMRNHGGTFVGANIPYDFSRIADSFGPATKSHWSGSKFCNGFAFHHHFRGWSNETKQLPRSEWGPSTLQKPIFCKIKRDDRHHVKYDMKFAKVIDVLHPVFAHIDRNHSLRTACEAFGVPFEDRPGKHSGEITRENVEGCLDDVAKTSELLWALDKEQSRHPIDLPLWRTNTGAGIAKAYLDAMGVLPRLEVQPDFPHEYLGYAAQTYFGGWNVDPLPKELFGCAYLDFLSMYVTVFDSSGLWFSHVIPARLVVEEIPPDQIEALFAEIRSDPDFFFDRANWPRLAFFALVYPKGALLPARANIPSPRRAADDQNITLGPLESKKPLGFAGPDLANAVRRGGAPEIVRAWRIRPESEALLSTLRPVKIRGDDLVDPRTENFFKRLIELRKRKTGDDLDDERRKTGYKVIANSGAYGIWAETNPVNVDPEVKRAPQKVIVYCGDDRFPDSRFETDVERPECPGRYNFFPVASLVTAYARLMLDLGVQEVELLRGTVGYGDTDSLIAAATQKGGFVSCNLGPYRAADGSRAVRALSWKQVKAVRKRFEKLNPYTGIPDMLLKLEDENYEQPTPAQREAKIDVTTLPQRQLFCYSVSENRMPSTISTRKIIRSCASGRRTCWGSTVRRSSYRRIRRSEIGRRGSSRRGSARFAKRWGFRSKRSNGRACRRCSN